MKRIAKLALFLVAAVVVFVAAFVGYQLLAVRGTFQHRRPLSEAPTSVEISFGTSGHALATREFTEHVAGEPPGALVIVLHGDAPFTNPSYRYNFSERVAQAAPNATVLAVLRRGYSDPYGLKSDGDRGFAIGENYTPEIIADMAEAIRRMKAAGKYSRVMLVGHSGGAAIAADVAAFNPGLIDQLVLVGCPCDVPAFRKHMADAQHDPMWRIPVRSLSPIATLPQMQGTTEITAISGADDPIALPEYAHAYIAAAKAWGLTANMITLPNEGHEILLDPRVIDLVASAARGNSAPPALPVAAATKAPALR